MAKIVPSQKTLILTASLFFCGGIAFAQMPPLGSLPGTGPLPPPPNPSRFTFVVGGDNRPGGKDCPQNGIPQKIFQEIAKTEAAFAFWTGDTIYGKQADRPEHIEREYMEFLSIVKTCGMPVFNAPGNHELDDKDNSPSETMKDLYERHMGRVYGAFTYGNSRFIALDSECPPPAGATKNGKESLGYIAPEQLKLLDQDLKAHKKLAHVFIFMHHPVIPAEPKDGLALESVKALEKIFKSYSNLSYVISGHEHMFYNPQGVPTKDRPPSREDPSAEPPFYLVSGGGGAPLEKIHGTFYHYLVFKVDGKKVSPLLVRVMATPAPCDK